MSTIANESQQRMTKAFKLIENGDVVLLQYGRAVVHGSEEKPYEVNFTRETCTCYDHKEAGNKCKHIWAAQLRQRQVVGLQ
jgi:uncharacterized Zn finger protein